jgi:hypothetical protein
MRHELTEQLSDFLTSRHARACARTTPTLTTNHPSEGQAMTRDEAIAAVNAVIDARNLVGRTTSANRLADALRVLIGHDKESPPPESIEIRIGVAMASDGYTEVVACRHDTDEQLVADAISNLESDGLIYAAIVVAHLPKPQIRVVQGIVEQVKEQS